MIRFLFVAALIVPNLLAQKSCPVTKPPNPAFIPPAPYQVNAGLDAFWYGDKDLWTVLPVDGSRNGLPYRKNEGYSNKLFLWKQGYDGVKEPEPDITVVVRPLLGQPPTATSHYGTNAFFDHTWQMLTGVTFPATGCWEVTASNAGHKLTFVLSIQQ
ncbi:MAG TPA: hypothetical protein VNU44_23420 [Bryobacteraceae bacterium]|jgi:hypothetical protein|nr:hypothetical protein [Bryobacteraceae bacterium]